MEQYPQARVLDISISFRWGSGAKGWALFSTLNDEGKCETHKVSIDISNREILYSVYLDDYGCE
jgi:hypothetical protein